jgi:hypothetical protein
MSNHTQGPWEYKRTSGFDYGSVEYWLPGICTNVKTEANARLIAAAPDLLEALNELIGWQPTAPHEAIQAAKAAITKATGGKE